MHGQDFVDAAEATCNSAEVLESSCGPCDDGMVFYQPMRQVYGAQCSERLEEIQTEYTTSAMVRRQEEGRGRMRVVLVAPLLLAAAVGVFFVVTRPNPAEEAVAVEAKPKPSPPADGGLQSEVKRLATPRKKADLSRDVDSDTGLPQGVTVRRVISEGDSARAASLAKIVAEANMTDAQQQLLFQVLDDARVEFDLLMEELRPHARSPDSPLFKRIDEIQGSFLSATDREIRDRVATFLDAEQMGIFNTLLGPAAFASNSGEYLAVVE